MKKIDFKNMGFEINLPVQMKVTKEDKDNITISLDRKSVNESFKKITMEKMVSVRLYPRGEANA